MTADPHDTLDGYRSHLKEKLDHCFARGHDPNPFKRFARNGVTRDIFEAERLRHLFSLLLYGRLHDIDQDATRSLDRITKIIRGSENAPAFCNVLAGLLHARCKDDTLKIWAKNLLQDKLRGIFSDSDLPLSESETEKAFGREDGPTFWQDQYTFCPVILEEGDESIYLGHRSSCPLPFLEEPQVIGKGSYATVEKVKIERGHLINPTENSALLSCKDYARKVYHDYDATAKKSFEAEGTTIKKFIQSAKSHENILVTKASLEHGVTYSLFFDLAKYSLDDYFMDPQTNITTLEQKKAILGQTGGIAGALAYLHEELYITSTGEQLRCYHLDLKPQNILVFESNGSEIWKISDFGISQIKRVPADQAHLEDHKHPTSFLDMIFRRGGRPDAESSSGVDNSRYGGTFAAPEARLATDKVTRTSDVWSLGCVLALILTFLDSGSEGIQSFASARIKDRDNDRFFESTKSEYSQKPESAVHPCILEWLETLVQSAAARRGDEGQVMQRAVDLLKIHMLLIEPRERWSAKKVELELRSIQSAFPESAKIGTETIHTKTSWQFGLPDEPKECKFSPDGHYLGVRADLEILIYTVKDIQESKKGNSLTAPSDRHWLDFSLGKDHVCAALKSRWFECVYLLYSGVGESTEYHVQHQVRTPIRKVMISPDGKNTAFVLERPDQQDGLMIHIYYTQEIIASCFQSSGAVEHNSPSDTPSNFDGSKKTEELPWTNLLKELHECNLPTTADLVDLKFSSDCRTLMAVTTPYKREGSHISQYSIFSWDVTTGRRLSTLTTKHEESEDMLDAWSIKKFALLAPQPSFAAISKTKIRLGSCSPVKYRAHSRTLADEILDIIADDDKHEFLLVGKAKYRGKIKAFRISEDEINDLESSKRSVETDLDHYNPITDSCCTLEDSENGQQGILLASIDPETRKGTLCKPS